MSMLNFLGIGKEIASPIEAVGDLIGKIYTTDGEKLSYQEMLERLRQNPQLWTYNLNKLNANDSRLFNSGWRPFIGWICGICVGIYYIPQFILATYLWTTMSITNQVLLSYPIDPRSLWELLYLLLGFGAYRSAEKLFGGKNKS